MEKKSDKSISEFEKMYIRGQGFFSDIETDEKEKKKIGTIRTD